MLVPHALLGLKSHGLALHGTKAGRLLEVFESVACLGLELLRRSPLISFCASGAYAPRCCSRDHKIVVFVLVHRRLPIHHQEVVDPTLFIGVADGLVCGQVGRDGTVKLVGDHGRGQVDRLDRAELLRRVDTHVEVEVFNRRAHVNGLVNATLVRSSTPRR